MDREIERALPTPAQLMEAPELAVLRVLQTALEVAEAALKATYPDDAEAVESRGGRSEPEAYALAILYQSEVLGGLIHEYVQSVGRLRESRERKRDEDDLLRSGDIP